MSDIVERLRKLADRERPYGSLPDTLDEAAAEIERLRADYNTARDAHDRRAAEVIELRAAMADNDLYVKTWSDDYDTTMAVLKDASTVLAFAFPRILSLPRSRDTELAADIGRCRAKIEKIIARAALEEKP